MQTPASESPIDDLRRGFSRTFKVAVVGTAAVGLVSIVTFALIAFWYSEPGVPKGQWTIGHLIAIRLAQITVAMTIGLFALCLGSVLCWLGTSAALSLKVNAGDTWNANLATLSPGIVLVLCGTAIIIVSLLRSIDANVGAGTLEFHRPPQDPSPPGGVLQ